MKHKKSKSFSKLLIYSFACLVIFSFIYMFIAHPAFAQTMDNGMYVIEEGDVSTFDFDSSISNTNTDSKNQTKSGEKSGTNYTVKSGNSFNKSSAPLTFSISNLRIDFGSLTPTNPVYRAMNLKIANNSDYEYKVSGAQNNQLTEIKSGSKIPDTTCDEGTCNESVSGKWASTLTYGFGYRCDFKDGSCVAGDSSFSEKDFYKQTSDNSADETAATILSGGPKTLQEAIITYKVNIPSSQPQGSYTNTITLLATPGY